jgi:MinD-like ATPase involved in chromosome partitioning or flagellar assembly
VPKIVSVHSFRGGTGKPNLTANLAVTVADQGRRVGIIDTDIQSPGIHVLFGLTHERIKHCLNDYLWNRCRIEETAYRVGSQDGADPHDGLFLIPSSLNTGDIARILREGYDSSRLNDGIRALVETLELDYLFIDTHPGVNEETLLSIAISDCLVIILRPDQQDYLGTAVTVDLARRLGVLEMLLVVNKVPSMMDFRAVQEKVEKAYDAEVAGVLPLNDEMVRLASSAIFCRRYPQHPFSDTVRSICARIG